MSSSDRTLNSWNSSSSRCCGSPGSSSSITSARTSATRSSSYSEASGSYVSTCAGTTCSKTRSIRWEGARPKSWGASWASSSVERRAWMRVGWPGSGTRWCPRRFLTPASHSLTASPTGPTPSSPIPIRWSTMIGWPTTWTSFGSWVGWSARPCMTVRWSRPTLRDRSINSCWAWSSPIGILREWTPSIIAASSGWPRTILQRSSIWTSPWIGTFLGNNR